MATQHQQESLTALYRSIKYCEELDLPCNDIYKALGHLEDELRKDAVSNINDWIQDSYEQAQQERTTEKS